MRFSAFYLVHFPKSCVKLSLLFTSTENFVMPQLVWFVTGCASGFGEAFARAVLARGDKVIATARNAETRLVALKEAGAAVLDLDVNAPFPEIEQKIQEAISVYGHVDVLVNNAGMPTSLNDKLSIVKPHTQ